MPRQSISRAQTTVNVRRALIRHWIDLDQLTVSPQRGYVRVSGRIELIQRDAELQGMASLLLILEEEIRRVKGVDRVLFDLDNWTKNSEGDWVPTERESSRSSVSSGSTKGTMLVVKSSGDSSAGEAPEPLPPPPSWGKTERKKKK